jgi:predicted ATPase/DNA-binding winged helix-turn-helix (wHTH) protein
MSAATVAGQRYVFGRYTVETQARRLLVDGRPARLSDRAFDLLLVLIAGRERMLDKNELLTRVWPGMIVEESNIYVHVSALRKLLGPSVISTVPGRGYRFIGVLEGLPPAPPAAPLRGRRHTDRADGAPAERAALGNVPAVLPPLFGRSDHLPTVLALLQNHRLVTLVGAGGIGKTRLAEAAAQIEHLRWPDGVWLVELAHTGTPEGVPGAVAQVLAPLIGAGLAGAGNAVAELAGALRGRQLLLVLDNAEHLLKAVAALAAALLEQAPRLKLLVTSREPLRLALEQQFRVPPLGVPLVSPAADPRQFGALALFEARAAAADPRFHLDEHNAAAVADICRRLDGLPLAIELAAARVPLLGIDGLRARLDDGLRVLTTSASAADPRHRTLRATFDWAHALLTPAEQQVLRRLALFVGGFTLELAQQVAAEPPALDEWSVLDLLGALVDKSLVVAELGERPRYRLLETTRAYATEKLELAGERAACAARHARVVGALFTDAEARKNGDGGTLSTESLLQRLAPEMDNLRAARDWALGPGGERASAVVLAAASAEALRLLGRSQEAASVMLELRADVDDAGAPDAAALFWNELSFLGKHGRLPRGVALEAGQRAVAIYRRLAQPRRVFRALVAYGYALATEGRMDEAIEVEAQMRAIEQPQWPGRARCLRLLLQSSLLEIQERFEEALGVLRQMRALLENEAGEEESLLLTMSNMCWSKLGLEHDELALALAREILQRSRSPRITVYAQKAAACALTHLGRLDEAAALVRNGIADWQRDKQLTSFLGLLALLRLRQGQVADAARLDGASAAWLARSGLRPSPEQRRARRLLDQAFAEIAVPADPLQRWRAEGAQAGEEALVRFCLPDAPGTRMAAGAT